MKATLAVVGLVLFVALAECVARRKPKPHEARAQEGKSGDYLHTTEPSTGDQYSTTEPKPQLPNGWMECKLHLANLIAEKESLLASKASEKVVESEFLKQAAGLFDICHKLFKNVDELEEKLKEEEKAAVGAVEKVAKRSMKQLLARFFEGPSCDCRG